MPVREWLERVEVTRPLEPGQRYQIELGKLQGVRDGRPVHMVGFEAKCSVRYRTKSRDAVVPGFYGRACLQDIVLQSGEHKWIDALDGDEVHFLTELRRGNLFEGAELPDIEGQGRMELDLTPGAQELDVTIRYNAAPASPYPGAENDGVIPLALLNHTKGANYLAFTPANTFKRAPGFEIESVRVTLFVILRALDELRLPTPHKMRGYNEGDTDFIIRPHGRLYSCVLRDTTNAEGKTAPPDVSGYKGISVTIDNEVLFHSFDAEDLIRLLNAQRPLGASIVGNSFLPIAVARATEKRSRMHSGAIRVEIQSRTDASENIRKNSRVLIHETGRMNRQYTASMLRILQSGGVSGGAMTPRAKMEARFAQKGQRTSAHPFADVLDHRLFWAGMGGMGFKVPERKFATVSRREAALSKIAS